MQGISTEFKSIVDSARRYSSLFNISHYKMLNIAKYGKEIIQSLNEIRFSSNIVSTVYLYSPYTKFAFSSTSSYTHKRMYQKIYGSEEFPEMIVTDEVLESFTEMLRRHDEAWVDKTPNGFIFYFPYPFSENSGKTYIIYEVNLAEMELFLSQITADSQTTAALLSQDGKEIFASAGKLKPQLGEVLKDIEIPQWSVQIKGSTVSQANGSTAYCREIPEMQMKLLVIVPEDAVVTTVRRQQLQMFLAILIALTVGGILDIFLSHIAYRPIQKLKSDAQALVPNGATQDNEFEVIGSVIESLRNSVIDLENLSMASRKELKRYIVLRLAQGTFNHDKALSELMQRLNMFTENNYVFAAAVYFSNSYGGETAKRVEQCLEYVEQIQQESVDIYASTGIERNQITLACSSEYEDVKYLALFFDEIRQSFAKILGGRIIMSVGLAYTGIDYLSTSYLQASNAYENRSINSCDDILFFSQSDGERIDIQYRNLLDFLRRAIQTCSIEEVENTMKYMLDFASKDDITLLDARSLCHAIVEIASSSFYSFKYDLHSDFNRKYNFARVLDIESIEDLQTFLTQISSDISKIIDEYLVKSSARNIDNEKQDLVARMTDYLDENVGNHQFSVSGMSAELGLSSSYLSRIYKEGCGETILESMNIRRMKKAKEMLANSNETVEAIVSAVGFYDVSSFIRKFKKMFGITPGEYRNELRKMQK